MNNKKGKFNEVHDEIQHNFVCIIQVKGRNKSHNEEIIIFTAT